MSKNIARLAVTAGLTAALSFGGVMAPVTMAFAEGAAGSITINKVDEANKDNTFKAYQIFKAKVADEGSNGKVASDIEWSSTTIGRKVIAAIKGSAKYKEIVDADGAAALADSATAPVVAEWLAKNVTGTSASSATSSEGTRVAPGDVLYAIAAAITDETPAGNSFKVDDSWTRPDAYGDGYYLFVPDGLTNPAKPNTGTSPIFAIVGGKSVTVTEKTSIPTVKKEVHEGKAWGKRSDSYIGEEVEYKLTGSVASNIDTFTKYEYSFHDHLSAGLEASENSVKVKIDDTVIQPTNGYTVNLADTTDASGHPTGGHDLTISFSDLKAAATNAGVTLKGDSKVVVTYNAKLTGEAEYTATGNTNDVKLVYSNNPMTDDKGTSESDEVTDYVFGLDVTKTASDNPNKKLVAGFKVKMTKEGTTPVNGEKWLTETGGLTDDSGKAGVFKTKETDSKVFIPGLVAGEYEITECETPAGYNSISFTIVVTPTYNETTGKLTGLSVKPSSNMVTSQLGEKVTSTRIPITIENKKGSNLPLTGLNGVTFTWIAGGAVLCIGVAHLIRSRKQAEESEQE
ncbi:MAG: isopeptide-forming domain-containing fimbrial protein [Collinsella sp.]|nr:isopeptide-forming domain-containing fimbrial protein [Collinsella sp.]MDU6508598.1 isopeptide-forming domain-containing fimbrial protein [Collinsella sp.]